MLKPVSLVRVYDAAESGEGSCTSTTDECGCASQCICEILSRKNVKRKIRSYSSRYDTVAEPRAPAEH